MKTSIEQAMEHFRMREYFTSEELWHYWKEMLPNMETYQINGMRSNYCMA